MMIADIIFAGSVAAIAIRSEVSASEPSICSPSG
jgi:hypothetical protein